MLLNPRVDTAPASPRPAVVSSVSRVCSDLLEFVEFNPHDIAPIFSGEGSHRLIPGGFPEVNLSFFPSHVTSGENSVLIGCSGHQFPASSLFLYQWSYPPFLFLCKLLPLPHHLIRKSWVRSLCGNLYNQTVPLINMKIIREPKINC